MAKVLVFSIENIFEDEYLIKVNLDVLIMLKLTYKTFYRRLIYIRLDRVLKIAKDVGIFISRVEALEYHYKLCTLSKSIHMISYIPLALTARCLIKIYIDIIEYKSLSTNGYRYIVYLLDRYFNYQ